MNDNYETRKFPGQGGVDVRIVRKEDVIKTIDVNITDKDIALELIAKLERDAAQYISGGVWCSIPYIGNIKRKDAKIAYDENSELFQDAKDKLSKNDFIVFRKNVIKEAIKDKKRSRFESYLLSKIINRNYSHYNKLVKVYSIRYAKLHYYLLLNLTIVRYDE